MFGHQKQPQLSGDGFGPIQSGIGEQLLDGEALLRQSLFVGVLEDGVEGLAVGINAVGPVILAHEFLDSGTEVLSLEPGGMGRLQLLCGGVFPLAGEKLNAGSRVHQILKLEIAATLVEVISGAVPVKRPIEVSANRARALRKAIELVNDHQNYPLSVEMICRETGVKARTLQYAFQEEFGMSPKRWLKLRSLNQVRKDLRQADSSQAKVVDVAYKWGLWHMGQFAKDYRLAFGELPSETLFGR